MSNLEQSVTIPDDVLVRIVDGEAVLLNLQNELYFGLDEVSTDFWHAISETDTLGQAFERLQAIYDVDGDRLTSDLVAFVRSLNENGLLELVDTVGS